MSKLRLVLIAVLSAILSFLFFGQNLSFDPDGNCVGPFNLSPTFATGRYEDPDAYSVYSAIIPTVAPNEKWGMWLIRSETLPYSKTNDLQPPGPPLGAAIKNYREVNAKSWFLQNRFSLSRPYKLFSGEELRKMFPSNSNEPFSSDWIELSAVGFNTDKTRAVVYMEQWCTNSCCCGDGWLYELKKTYFGRWRITKQAECWVS